MINYKKEWYNFKWQLLGWGYKSLKSENYLWHPILDTNFMAVIVL